MYRHQILLYLIYFQYFSAKQKYSEALSYAMTVGKFRNMAITLGVERGVRFLFVIV